MNTKTFCLVLLAAAGACTTSDPSSSSQETQAVIERHLQVFLANDIDAVMSDYTEDSRLFAPDKTYVGLDEIRGAFTNFFQLLPAASTQLTVDRMTADEETFYMTYHGESQVVRVPFASDTFVVLDGKISTQSVAFVVEPKQ